MSSVLRPVRKRKKGRTLGPVNIIQREDYTDLELDTKVELIRSLVPLGLMHVQEVLDQEVPALAGEECAVCAAVASVCRTVDRHAATRMRGSTAVLVCVGPGRQTGGLPGLLQCASGPCVVGRADARPDTKGCRTARPLPMGRALPWSLSDADRGVTSDQRRRWRAGRRARVRRLSRHSRAVRQLHAFLMPSRQLRGGLPAHGTRRSNDVGFLRIRHPQLSSSHLLSVIYRH